MSLIKLSSQRDQGRSEFTSILEEFCELTHAQAAVLVDQEGEAVDYAGQGSPFDLRVLAAEWRLVLQLAHQGLTLSSAYEFNIFAQKKNYQLRCLPEGYALVVHLAMNTTSLSVRVLSHTIQRLCQEAGFEAVNHGQLWSSVTVEEEALSYRPTAFTKKTAQVETYGLEVLGRLDDRQLQANEAGYRVRLENGLERTLIREPMGFWFLEEERWRS